MDAKWVYFQQKYQVRCAFFSLPPPQKNPHFFKKQTRAKLYLHTWASTPFPEVNSSYLTEIFDGARSFLQKHQHRRRSLAPETCSCHLATNGCGLQKASLHSADPCSARESESHFWREEQSEKSREREDITELENTQRPGTSSDNHCNRQGIQTVSMHVVREHTFYGDQMTLAQMGWPGRDRPIFTLLLNHHTQDEPHLKKYNTGKQRNNTVRINHDYFRIRWNTSIMPQGLVQVTCFAKLCKFKTRKETSSPQTTKWDFCKGMYIKLADFVNVCFLWKEYPILTFTDFVRYCLKKQAA